MVWWCFEPHWSIGAMCRVAAAAGCRSIELLPVEHWPVLQEHGLACAIARSHGFVEGMNHTAQHERCLATLRRSIDAAARFGVPNVITFTGYATTDAGTVGPEQGMRNCVTGFKQIIPYAEKAGVNLCLEMLNSRVDEHMKGHPGYQGDDIEYCLDIVRQVDSPHMKLLFDIYHVQIMHGDVIRRVRECAPWIGHVHTAGNPGRRELDDQQEINYPPIMRALLETGYPGYVGQEFIPTTDPRAGLEQAVRVCEV
jgi:hydroxypyruvate isomerase